MGRLENVRKYQSTIIEKICIECGKPFTQMRKLKGICSEECKKARRQKLRPQTYKTCLQCGKTFGPIDQLRLKYCSVRCACDARVSKPNSKKGRKYPHLERARIGKCLTCGKEFRATKDFSDKRQVYCSHRCYLKNRRVSKYELMVGEALRQAGIRTEAQVRIGRWTIDFSIRGTKILIEADGSFWHQSAKVKEKDNRKDAVLRSRGYEVYRIDEIKFYKDRASAISEVIKRWEQFTGNTARKEA